MRVRETTYGQEISSRDLEEIIGLIKNDRIRNKIEWRENHIIPISAPSHYIAQRSDQGSVIAVWRMHPLMRPFPLYQSKLNKARAIITSSNLAQ